MPTFTEHLNLKKPLPDEYYNVEDMNENSNIIDHAIHYIDGGGFTLADDIDIHNMTPTAHENITVDGASIGVVDGQVTTIAEHNEDETAHPNIILDGTNSL